MKNSAARTPRAGFGSIFNDQLSSVSRDNPINVEGSENAGTLFAAPYRYRPDYDMFAMANDKIRNNGQ